jgi:oxygen-independent coproporphyrinogen-3 oxidase
MEGYFELVVERLEGAGYRWYETANFCRIEPGAAGRDLRAQHNLMIWLGHDYVGLGVGAVSTVGALRRRNLPSLGRYVDALRDGRSPPRESETLDDATRAGERLMLGLRLDEPVAVAALGAAIDREALERLSAGGLVERRAEAPQVGELLTLTRRGRFLGGAVTAELVAWPEEPVTRPPTVSRFA